MIIYKVQNKINGKIYIGQTSKQLNERILSHLKEKNSPILHKALNKYGLNSFDNSEIDSAETKKESDEKEKYWIKFYDCKAPNGYNLTDGGDGFIGGKHSEESKKKMGISRKLFYDTHPEAKEKKRIAYKGKGNPMFGKQRIFSEETRKKIAENSFSRTLEFKMMISESNRKRKRKPLTEESRQKISEASLRREMKGKKRGPNKKKTKIRIDKGKKRGTDWKQKIRSDKGKKRKPFSEEHKRKLSESKRLKLERGKNYGTKTD